MVYVRAKLQNFSALRGRDPRGNQPPPPPPPPATEYARQSQPCMVSGLSKIPWE